MNKSFRVYNWSNQDGGEEFPSSDVYSAPRTQLPHATPERNLEGAKYQL